MTRRSLLASLASLPLLKRLTHAQPTIDELVHQGQMDHNARYPYSFDPGSFGAVNICGGDLGLGRHKLSYVAHKGQRQTCSICSTKTT